MTKFTIKPYIETILAELSGENKAKLLNLVNGKKADGTDSTVYTLVETIGAMSALSAGVTAVEYRYSKKILWKGYFVKTTNYQSFITFKSAIDLTKADIYKISAGQSSIMGEVSADNLRTLLREDSYIDASEIPEAPDVFETTNITGLSDSQIDALKVGDVIHKITGSAKHCYIVTYKQERHGICLTYTAAGYIETVSYDYTDGHWVYNSTDIVSGLESALKMPSGLDPAKTYTLKIEAGVLVAVEDE